MKLLIPGGAEYGIFPKPFLIATFSQIERVGREFLRRYSNRLKTYDPNIKLGQFTFSPRDWDHLWSFVISRRSIQTIFPPIYLAI